MNSKQYVRSFIVVIFLVLLFIGGLNYFIDPFSALGNQEWYSYGFTQNPRIGKINYLKNNTHEFDSFIIGASGSASFPVEALNKYTGGDFYNLFYYGADMRDSLNTVKYVVENTDVKNIILPLGFTHASKYNYGDDALNDKMHYELSGEGFIDYYTKLFFANPQYSFDKIKAKDQDTYIHQDFDVFNVSDGSYDKSLRDVESISTLDDYLDREENIGFSQDASPIDLKYINEFAHDLREIISICEENGVDYKVIMVPMYFRDFEAYDRNQVTEFYDRLSEITEFWDFTNTPISYDARYFYDRTHFRNAVGSMVLGTIYEDESVYRPRDFGILVEKDQGQIALSEFNRDKRIDESEYSFNLPVFMYHDINSLGDNNAVLAINNLKNQLRLYRDQGYNTLSISELIEYTKGNIELPDKNMLITFDDGYTSNYNAVFPLLQEHNMKATIFVIGSSMGKTTYKGTNNPITPHFSIAQAKDMVSSGLVEVQSHSYDLHQSEKFEPDRARTNMLRLTDETESEYINTIITDIEKNNQIISEITGSNAYALAFPYGEYEDLLTVVAAEKGIKATLTTKPGMNTLIKGLPQSLYGLKRYVIIDDTSDDVIIDILNN